MILIIISLYYQILFSCGFSFDSFLFCHSMEFSVENLQGNFRSGNGTTVLMILVL